jgi:hypothetical protein
MSKGLRVRTGNGWRAVSEIHGSYGVRDIRCMFFFSVAVWLVAVSHSLLRLLLWLSMATTFRSKDVNMVTSDDVKASSRTDDVQQAQDRACGRIPPPVA